MPIVNIDVWKTHHDSVRGKRRVFAFLIDHNGDKHEYRPVLNEDVDVDQAISAYIPILEAELIANEKY